MPDKAPPKKPKKFMPMLDMLNTEAAVNTLSPKTYADYVGIFSRKAFENGEIDVDEYLGIVKPLFGETGEKVNNKIKEYEEFFKNAEVRLDEISKDYQQLDQNSKSEYDGLKKMFDILLSMKWNELKKL